MGVRREEKLSDKIGAVRVFFRDGSYKEISATDIEVNRLVDEIIIWCGIHVKAKFYTHNIAGYEVLTEAEGYAVIACGDD